MPDNFCPCCNCNNIRDFLEINDFKYFQCIFCGVIFIDNKYIDKIDNGFNLVKYEQNYWKNELASAQERSYGPALARMSEVFFYSKIPIKKFLDIGTGPGYFLNAIKQYLPNNEHIFYGVEKYPPPLEYRSTSNNYIIGELKDIQFHIDGGICIEVIEHLTPRIFENLLKDLADISNEGALYIFNSGMPSYVINEDIKYLDPTYRGHIMSYSLKAVELLSKKYGFTTFELKGKTWAFVLEYKSSNIENNIHDRIWSALKENLNILCDKEMGSVLKLLGFESSKAYPLDEEIKKRNETIQKQYKEIVELSYREKSLYEEIKKREEAIEKQKNEIKNLEEKKDKLNKILGSRGWKLLSSYYKIKDFFKINI